MHTLLFLTDDNQPIYTNTFTEEVKGNKKLEIFSMPSRNDGGRRLCQLPVTDTPGDKEYDDLERPGRREARRQRHRRCICRRRDPRYTKAAKCPSASSARQAADTTEHGVDHQNAQAADAFIPLFRLLTSLYYHICKRSQAQCARRKNFVKKSQKGVPKRG